MLIRRIGGWGPALGLRAAFLLSLALFTPLAGTVRTDLHLEVLRGEGANNNALHRLGISSAVRALDASGQPIAGVLVVFSAPAEGASVVFSGFDAEANMLTDDSGVAVAPGVRPTGGNGPVEISVLASHAGEFATCVIHQMNLGLGSAADRERELDVVRLPLANPVGSKATATPEFSVRVEDAKGVPVPLAAVLFVLRRVSNDGKAEELSRMEATAGQNGEATGAIPKRSGNRNLEFMVVALDQGRRATRYFRID